MPIAIAIVTRGKVRFVAALPYMPTPWPMNIWSTMLYTEFTTIDAIAGRENLSISLPIDSFSNMASELFWFIISPVSDLKIQTGMIIA